MSLKVIKAGIADTFQDEGRFGHQHLGINPNGAMDQLAIKVANALVGNQWNESTLELCFPASTLFFKKSALIALSGANFTAQLNGVTVPINQAITVPSGSEIKFTKAESGVFCYLAIGGGFKLEHWMNSFSTNTKATTGGWKGRSLQKDDEVEFKNSSFDFKDRKILPWRANVYDFYADSNLMRVIPGNEYNWLHHESMEKLFDNSFEITLVRDRMGYRLKGNSLSRENKELISTAATFGTVQLLPDGQLIILMADHQTTGGYPRVAQIISSDRSKIVQAKPGEKISFREVSIQEAEDLAMSFHKILKQIQVTCTVRLNDFLKSV